MRFGCQCKLRQPAGTTMASILAAKSLRLLICLFLLLTIVSVDTRRTKRRRSFTNVVYNVGVIFGKDMKTSPMRAAFQFQLARNALYKNQAYKIRVVPVIERVDDISDSFQITAALCRLVSKQVVATFGPIHHKTAHTIQSFTDFYQHLYITASEASHFYNADRQELKGRHILKLRPLVVGPVIDYISAEGWERIFYLYDSRQALLRLRGIFENFNNREKPLSTDVRPLNLFTDSNDVLQYINTKSKEKKKRVILDLLKKESRDLVLNQISEMKLAREDYHFMILGSDFNELNMTPFQNGGFNVTVLSQLNMNDRDVKNFMKEGWNTKERKQSFKMNTDSNEKMASVLPYEAALMIDGVNVLLKALAGMRTKVPTVSLSTSMPCVSLNQLPYAAEKLLESILSSRHKGLTGEIQFDANGFRKHYQVSIYGSGVRRNLEMIGNWKDDRKPRLRLTPKSKPISVPQKPGQRIRNVTRIVTSILVPPFLMYKEDENGKSTGEFEGFCVDLIEAVANKTKFNYTIKVVEDEQFGAQINSTTWNGMIGELISGQAHIAVAPLTITSSRERVVDFSTPFMEIGLSIMFKKPDNPPKDVFSFMEPLSKEIWMCIAFAYLGVSVVLFMVSRFNPEEWHHLHNSDSGGENKVTNDFSIFNSFWFSLSAFMQQGGDISPRSFSGRIVGGVWWFFTLIIVSSYTANLAAYLTVERMSTPIQSHEDLVKQTKIRYGVVNSGSSKEFFKENKMQVFKKMWSFMESNPEVFAKNMKEGVNRVIQSRQDYAFLMESKMNEYYNQQKPCKTMKVGPNLDSGKGYGIATPSGSDLRDAINLAVLELKEKNKIHELTIKWWEEKGQCGKKEQKNEKSGMQNSLDLENVRGLFYILAGGLALGISLSTVEFLYKCALEAKRKQRNFGTVLCEMMETSSKGKQKIPNSWSSAPTATPMSGLRSSGHPSPIPTQHLHDAIAARSHEKMDMEYPY